MPGLIMDGFKLMLLETIHRGESANERIHALRSTLVEMIENFTPDDDCRDLWAEFDALEFYIAETLDALLTILASISPD